MQNFRVTVVVLTYNHEKYIREAIQSILNQKTNFDVKIIASNDGSTDGTLPILKELKNKHPEEITLISREQNIGIRKSIPNLVDQVEGDYLAILDGDDYWSYENKLQEQVHFLDNNPSFNGVFHDALIKQVDTSGKILYGGKKMYSQSYVFPEEITASDIIERNIILPSSSAVIRLAAINTGEWNLIRDDYSFLWKLTLFAIKNSKYKFINEPWSVYRNHKGGISKRDFSSFYLDHIVFLKSLLIDEYFKFHKKSIYAAMALQYYFLFNQEKNPRKKALFFRKYFVCLIKKMLQEKRELKQ